jgi:hypothetical protein
MDERGILLHIGVVSFMGLLMVALAVISLAFRGYDIELGMVWEWSWLLFGLGMLLLTARALGMNLWALILVPVICSALWYFGVMGGGI